MCCLWVFHRARDWNHHRKHSKYPQWVNLSSNQSNTSIPPHTTLMYFSFWQRWCGQLHPSLWCLCSSSSWPSSSVTWDTFVRSAPSWPSFLESSSSSQVERNLSFALRQHLLKLINYLYPFIDYISVFRHILSIV